MSIPVQGYSEQQRREAAEWFIDIHGAEDISDDLLQRWRRWLEASEGNRLAFHATEIAWHQSCAEAASTAEDFAASGDDDYDGSISVAKWLRSRTASTTSEMRQTVRRSRLRLLGLAASACFAVATGWWAYDSYGPFNRPASGDFRTGTGEHMELTLADGSRIALGAQSQLSIGFNSDAREVTLKSGEAFFTVRKDSERPFRVHALGSVITAVGTAFNVRTAVDRVTVAVTEGKVNIAEVAPRALQQVPAILRESRLEDELRLSSGEKLTFTASNDAPELRDVMVTRVDPAEPARWRDGWLVYRNEPLRYVIADVARYTKHPIKVSSSLQADLQFTGAVYKDSVVEWVETLPEVFPVTVRISDDGLLIANAASGHPAP